MTREPWQITREMFLSVDEVQALRTHVHRRAREAAAPDMVSARGDELIIEALLFSGLRNSEFCRLTVGDTVVGTGESAFQVRGTPREDRVVYVPRFVSELVRKYVKQIRPVGVADGVDRRDRSQPLVLNERGRPYERTGLYRRVVRILDKAGLGDRASVQLLRHTYGYLAYLRTGGNLLFVQRQLGHAHPMVTSVYAQFVEHSYATLADAIGADALAARHPTRRAVRRGPVLK